MVFSIYYELMESLILYIILFITILIGSYLIFENQQYQKNIKNENNSDDINLLKESINTHIKGFLDFADQQCFFFNNTDQMASMSLIF